jgi:hypothetical protein
MILIVQENSKAYINKDQVKTIHFNERSNEARVLFIDGGETKYFDVKSVKC